MTMLANSVNATIKLSDSSKSRATIKKLPSLDKHPNRRVIASLLREYTKTRRMIRELERDLKITPTEYKFTRHWLRVDIQELEWMLVDIQDDLDHYVNNIL